MIYHQAPDCTFYLGDVRECLDAMPAESVQAVITSPLVTGGVGTCPMINRSSINPNLVEALDFSPYAGSPLYQLRRSSGAVTPLSCKYLDKPARKSLSLFTRIIPRNAEQGSILESLSNQVRRAVAEYLGHVGRSYQFLMLPIGMRFLVPVGVLSKAGIIRSFEFENKLSLADFYAEVRQKQSACTRTLSAVTFPRPERLTVGRSGLGNMHDASESFGKKFGNLRRDLLQPKSRLKDGILRIASPSHPVSGTPNPNRTIGIYGTSEVSQ